ncbi:hypothetical protein O0I10_010365 [Lichtheimia ornata]|uniref:WDR59/RTC1-like RING zinc finger domain-containing protein n=1 Tax=Lichtheimia ornata TaxID=688661 RepID=A0AAD7XXT9_9FUNG|nr:uncharacterized protein O0I10_010365 [Lichtheimia ornata]KAJ8653917.1 hypothetical protein O0I10_010365 [Lichtheimia ornata]
MRKSNRSNSGATGASGAGGRMQRIVSQAGFYAATRLSSESNDTIPTTTANNTRSKALGTMSDSLASEPLHRGANGLIRYRLPGTVNTISISQDRELVAVAGREVLKVLTVSPTHVDEVLNLRAGSNLKANYSVTDIKWGNNVTKNKVVTAATNGSIVLWDINKATGRRAERMINEHSRSVNRVCFQPENGHILLSASQDGTMRCWDLREPRAQARYRFEGKSESVRDVQFNPLIHHEFAAAFEAGIIQKWDMRNPKTLYEKKMSAHNGPCLTIDWHANGRWVASAGRDKTIKVWDMSVDSRRPLYTIRTMAAVARIQWRPDHENEITSCSLISDSRMYIWDIRRPHIAKYAFNEHDSSTTGFIWYDADVLYSSAKDKTFVRQAMQHAYEPANLLCRNGMGWNIQGDLAFAVDQSARDKFVDESVIPRPTVSQPKKWKKLAKMPIEQEVVQYIPPQSCGIAHLPLFDFEAFSLFAENYDISNTDILASCEKNCEIAWKLSRYRTAQAWKIISLLFRPEHDGDKEDEVDDDDDEEQEESGRKANGEASEKSGIDSDTEDTMTDLWQAWEHEGVIHELLEYYTEQGDVQMCVTLYLVLQNHITVNHDQIEDWFSAYIDLLQRFKLWTTAAAVINACPVSRIRERNENSTTINIACNNCFKLVSGSAQGAWACDKCHQLLNGCSICHQTVRGLYVWCQGCNHGGHLEHMREWFSNEPLCPTGCGHSCKLSPL